MGQISAYQEAPYQGVSQAPPQVRRRDQAEALEDVLTAIPEGCDKRPPFQYAGTLAGHPGHTNGVFHRVERTEGDAFYALTREGSVTVPRVYDLATMIAQVVAIEPAAQAYLNANVSTPALDIGAQTVVDYTFTWNRARNVDNSPDTESTRPYEALIWVRGGAYGRTYTVKVNGATQVSLRTPNGATSTDAKYVDTEVIAAALMSGAYGGAGINEGTVSGAGLGSLAGFAVSRIGPLIYITNGSTDFTVQAEDGQGGTAMTAAKDTIQKFSDLPVKAPDGFTVRIVQQSGTNQDDYFVRFRATAGDGTGVWEECLAPGAQLGLEAATMPVGLLYDAGWQLNVLDWKQRETGDESLVRDPDFIGQPVEDLTFWQGRLGIVSGEGVTLSAADDPFQLYPRTLSLVLDSDPIGRTNPAKGETTFRYAIPFENRLVLAGDKIQAEVTSDGTLTPGNASIDEMTGHEMSPLIRPSSVNGKLYLVSPKGSFAAIQEVAVDRVTNVALGEDLNTAAFRYLPGNIDRSAVCPVSFTTVYGASGSGTLYVHLFRHSDMQRVQNAFERWSLPTGYALGGMFFKNTVLYVLACKGGIAHVLKADLSPVGVDPDPSATIETCLDMKASEAQVSGLSYDPATDRTTMVLPYAREATTALVVRAPGTATEPEGYVPDVDEVASAAAGANSLVVSGDLTAVPFYVGHKYESLWHLSRIYPLDRDSKPLRNGRCQLRRITLDLAHAGYIRAEVTAGGRETRIYEFFGLRYDDPASLYERAPSATVRWGFPVMAENEQVDIKLINDSPFRCAILGMEWVAEFNPRSDRT